MENMKKELTVPKWMLINWLEIPPNTPKYKLIREWIFVLGNDWKILTTIMEVPVPRKNPKRSNKSQDLYCLVREPHWSYNSGPHLLSQHNSLGKDQSKFNLTIFFPPKKFEKKMWKHNVSNLLHWNYKSGH